jgi:hypothetical protein
MDRRRRTGRKLPPSFGNALRHKFWRAPRVRGCRLRKSENGYRLSLKFANLDSILVPAICLLFVQVEQDGITMPRGPKGEKRPADAIGNAVHVMRIATGEIEEDLGKTPKRAKGGRKGGKARARSLTAEQRSEIARAAASARWKKS